MFALDVPHPALDLVGMPQDLFLILEVTLLLKLQKLKGVLMLFI